MPCLNCQIENKWPCIVCCLQDSEVVYCGRLSLVADLLQGLFKEAYSLQKGLLELLDKISLDSRASEEVVFEVVTGMLIYVSLCLVNRTAWS